MADRFINLSDSEARALNGGASILIVPMKSQPPSWVKSQVESVGGKWFSWIGEHPSRPCESVKCAGHPYGGGSWTVKAPFAPGDILNCREAWGLAGARAVDPCLNYRADGAQVPLHGWQRARSMPKEFIRHKPVVASVSAIRVSEIGEEDAIKVGFKSQHFDWSWRIQLVKA